MDEADIRTSVTSSDFWWAARAADLRFLLHVPRVSVQEFQLESGVRTIDCEIGAAASPPGQIGSTGSMPRGHLC